MVFIFLPGAPEKKTDVGSTEGGMTKKYTPPGGWAAQRQRQILWFLAVFLFFGGMGWYLQSQWAEIWRIDRETQRLRAEAHELEDEDERARQGRHDFLRRLQEQAQEQRRVDALVDALMEQQRRIRIQRLRDANEQAAGEEWRAWQNAWQNQFVVPMDGVMAVRPGGRYVPERVRVGGEERAHLDDRNRGRQQPRRRIRRGQPGPGMRGLGLGWLDRPDDGQGEAP